MTCDLVWTSSGVLEVADGGAGPVTVGVNVRELAEGELCQALTNFESGGVVRCGDGARHASSMRGRLCRRAADWWSQAGAR